MGTYESEIASTNDGPIIKQTDFVIGDTATSTVGSGSDPSDIATTNASSLHLLYRNTLGTCFLGCEKKTFSSRRNVWVLVSHKSFLKRRNLKTL